MAVVLDASTEGVRVQNLSFAYPGEQPVLNNVSFDVLAGSRVLLAGATGSGKSTLLRCLKPELTPHGSFSGRILVDGTSTLELNPQLSAGRIGFVMQDPRQQIVMDTVKAELAFGLENLSVPQAEIQRRVAEIANYFGINSWVERSTTELSGGETQIVNLAAIIAMQPQTLLLDEPTSMLDPIAAREFIELVKRINEELGITIVLVEHHQEDLLSSMNQVLYLDKGSLAFNGSTREFAAWMYASKSTNCRALPVATQLYLRQSQASKVVPESIPLDVREGRWWLWKNKEESFTTMNKGKSPNESLETPQSTSHFSSKGTSTATTVLAVTHMWYRYTKETPYILKDLSLEVSKGSILGIVGANASGKSTLLSLLFGAHKPQHGKVKQLSSLQYVMLPQDPTSLFLRDSVYEDLMDHAKDFDYGASEVQEMLARLGLLAQKDRHPFDLSGGEQQKLALGKLLLCKPDVLLLDEPTKGLDSEAQTELRDILKAEAAEERTIIFVSHDLEFVASTATECLMLFDGATVGRASTRAFFTGNMFYTTALQRITQGILVDCPPVLDWTGAEYNEGAYS